MKQVDTFSLAPKTISAMTIGKWLKRNHCKSMGYIAIRQLATFLWRRDDARRGIDRKGSKTRQYGGYIIFSISSLSTYTNTNAYPLVPWVLFLATFWRKCPILWLHTWLIIARNPDVLYTLALGSFTPVGWRSGGELTWLTPCLRVTVYTPHGVVYIR